MIDINPDIFSAAMDFMRTGVAVGAVIGSIAMAISWGISAVLRLIYKTVNP